MQQLTQALNDPGYDLNSLCSCRWSLSPTPCHWGVIRCAPALSHHGKGMTKWRMWSLGPGAFQIYIPLEGLIESTCPVHPFTHLCSSHLWGTDWAHWVKLDAMNKANVHLLSDSCDTPDFILCGAFIFTLLLHCESLSLICLWQNSTGYSCGRSTVHK